MFVRVLIMFVWILVLLFVCSNAIEGNVAKESDVDTSTDSPVKLPTKCETCKFMALELESRFQETGKTHDVITGSKGQVKKYRDSELRFLETLEGLCNRILDYKMHKEHGDSRRFAKKQSETMKTLHGSVPII